MSTQTVVSRVTVAIHGTIQTEDGVTAVTARLNHDGQLDFFIEVTADSEDHARATLDAFRAELAEAIAP